ncbi:MAG: hypothetical protein GWO16_01430 [Gammaproteobacteria bacterium]|nr:hypothetical protein [Gammaproteobacteria bacterium]NIR96792.1 hypothetical protein [Gammaproteobacteria bacterium]NIT62492.1 hypothetical protein [Gammaproteobacteria bacterium]NIV19432.1 hypothetical protein [Gammaproteobacteria bacterium]NIX10515.1 hypothetical protein [Gammaproteobacteria bacterium]
MDTLLVSYDCSPDGENSSRLLDAIRHYPCARLSELSYAISTSESPKEVFDKLSRYLESEDCLYVIPLTGPWEGRGPKYVSNLFQRWL